VHNFDTFLETQLNKTQRDAVVQKHGAVLVIAGAGSGKTRVITARMAHQIIKQNVGPSQIVALTFTNKAASEMKARLATFIDEGLPLPFVGTFHSYCLKLLRSNPSLVRTPNFTILDSDDQTALIKKILKNAGAEKQMSANQLKFHISSIKNTMRFSPQDIETLQPLVREVHAAYEHEKKTGHMLDFDDILLHTLDLLKDNPGFRSTLQSRISHILVDEYQDTNIVQHHLLKLLAQDGEGTLALDSIAAVGDEDQSIYSWRGAAPQNMIKFQEEFAPVSIIKIEQNYRSVQPILEAANRVIANNTMRHPKQLWSDKQAQDRILSVTCRSDYQEPEIVRAFLAHKPQDLLLRDVAILYRTHAQSRVIEEVFAQNGIPYQIIGGIYFYARKEIKDLLAYLRLIVNPYDRVSFSRIINYPLRGLGQKTQDALLDLWAEQPFFTFIDLCVHAIEHKACGITGKKVTALESFLSIFKDLKKSHTPSSALDTILKKTAYQSYLLEVLEPKEAETKIENVREFIRSTTYFEQASPEKHEAAQSRPPEPKTLEDFLHDIALLQEKIESQDHADDRIQMMSLHAAKGLEFDTVFLVGLEEGIFPSGRALNSFEALEEERRLFYVGMTRAQERLILCHALFRNQYGQFNNQETSRFWDEVPTRLTKQVNLSEFGLRDLSHTMQQWLGGKQQLHRTDAHKPRAFQASDFACKPSRKEPSKKPTSPTGWKKNQIVTHPAFGQGIIIQIEERANDQHFITALFRAGKKKILSTHLELE
jgi:DNA helicase-2/ATP-dependent DNA helicase PcrA